MLGLGLGLSFLTGFGFGFSALVVWCGFCAIAVARKNASLPAVFAILLLSFLGAWQARHADAESIVSITPGTFSGMLHVSDGPFLTGSGQRFIGEIERDPGARICVYSPGVPQVFTGDRVFATGRVTLLADLSDVGESAARTRGCEAQLSIESMQVIDRGAGVAAALSRFRVRLSEFLMRAEPGDVGALLSGLATGEDGGLSADASDAFLSSGTTHITAISGANFALIGLLLGAMASGSMKRSIWFVVVATALIWIFALLIGLQPSSLRAALLATAVLAGKWLGRRPDLLTLTTLLAALQIAVRPQDFGTLAFQLSLAATVALIVVFDGSEREHNRAYLTTLGFCVLAAQMATLPILAWQLGTVSVTSLLANVIVGPLAGGALPIALLGALIGQVVPIFGELFLLPARVACQVILFSVEWVDRALPGSMQLGEPTLAAIGTIGLACWLWIFWMSGDLRRMARHGHDIARSW